uniref:Secreted protein n=1 Tax=Panagrellus redivivus TaxID=6233 RepID=A0A7E4UWT9_PANRE
MLTTIIFDLQFQWNCTNVHQRQRKTPPPPKDPAKSEKMKAIWEARMKKRAAQAQRNLAAVRKRCSKPDSSATSSK